MYVLSSLSINRFNNVINKNKVVENIKYKKCFIYADESINEFVLIPIKYYNKYGLFKVQAEFYKE